MLRRRCPPQIQQSRPYLIQALTRTTGPREALLVPDRLRSPADSLSAGPPDRRVNSTPVFATYRFGCGTHRSPRDTSNGVARHNSRPKSGLLAANRSRPTYGTNTSASGTRRATRITEDSRNPASNLFPKHDDTIGPRPGNQEPCAANVHNKLSAKRK